MQPGHLLHFRQETPSFSSLGCSIAHVHPFQIRASFTHIHFVFGRHSSPHSVTFSFEPAISRRLATVHEKWKTSRRAQPTPRDRHFFSALSLNLSPLRVLPGTTVC